MPIHFLLVPHFLVLRDQTLASLAPNHIFQLFSRKPLLSNYRSALHILASKPLVIISHLSICQLMRVDVSQIFLPTRLAHNKSHRLYHAVVYGEA